MLSALLTALSPAPGDGHTHEAQGAGLRLGCPTLSEITRHDHEALGYVVIVSDEIGEEGLSTESKSFENILSRLLADCHPRPELFKAARPRYGENLASESPADPAASVCG